MKASTLSLLLCDSLGVGFDDPYTSEMVASKINRKVKWVILSTIGLMIVGCFLALSASGRLVDMYQVAESDGHRQLEYKILGFIPYEKQVESPETQVTADYWREMDKSGIVIGPEIDRKARGNQVLRIVRPHETQYWLRKDVKGDHAALVAKYSAQVPSPDPYSSTWTYHTPHSPTSTKKPSLKILIDLRSKGAKPKDDVSDLGIGITVPRQNELK